MACRTCGGTTYYDRRIVISSSKATILPVRKDIAKGKREINLQSQESMVRYLQTKRETDFAIT